MKAIKTTTLLFDLATIIIFSLPAISGFANQNEHYPKNGLYIEANAGILHSRVYFLFGDSESSIGGFGVNANIGYQFNRFLSVESGYGYYQPNELGFNAVDVAGKLTIPLGQQFKIFGKLGAAYLFNDADGRLSGGPGIFNGVGIGYAFTPEIEATIQYVGIDVPFVGVHILGGGITFHF